MIDLTKDLANAIIAYSEGLFTDYVDTWNELVLSAELVAERKSDYHKGNNENA